MLGRILASIKRFDEKQEDAIDLGVLDNVLDKLKATEPENERESPCPATSGSNQEVPEEPDAESDSISSTKSNLADFSDEGCLPEELVPSPSAPSPPTVVSIGLSPIFTDSSRVALLEAQLSRADESIATLEGRLALRERHSVLLRRRMAIMEEQMRVMEEKRSGTGDTATQTAPIGAGAGCQTCGVDTADCGTQMEVDRQVDRQVTPPVPTRRDLWSNDISGAGSDSDDFEPGPLANQIASRHPSNPRTPTQGRERRPRAAGDRMLPTAVLMEAARVVGRGAGDGA